MKRLLQSIVGRMVAPFRLLATALAHVAGVPAAGASLGSVASLAVLVLVLSALGPALWQWTRDHYDKSYIHGLQDEVQVLEGILEDRTKTTLVPGPGAGEIGYADVSSQEILAKDLWSDGHLRSRLYFHSGELLAKDTFHYEKGRPLSKVREYVVLGAVVLTDKFSATGLLVEKVYCRHGDSGDCRRYQRDFRSPLPTPPLPFYR